MRLKDKRILITGGSRGLGLAIAQAAARHGARVAFTFSTNTQDADAAKASLVALGCEPRVYQGSVADSAHVKATVADLVAAWGGIDVLVNNAGIMQIGRPLWEEDDLTAQRMVDININGVLYGIKEVVPRMLRRGRGHVVNIASSAGKGGFPGGATYCGTKHFVVGASEALRAELRGTGIEVSCVMPVVVNTELASGLQQTRGVKQVQPEDVAAEIVDALKVPRFDVFVPSSVAHITRVMTLLPRGGREAISRALKADQVLAKVDEGARRDYELRATKSEPGLESPEEPKQLTS